MNHMDRKHATWTYDGRTSHPLYSTWRGMIERCRNSHMRDWGKYGGKGVKVCDRWRDPVYGFFNFVSDMGERPRNCTLDRIDCDGDYSPENCRWATHYQQQNNRKVKPNTGVVGVSQQKSGYYLAEVCFGSSRKRKRKVFKSFNEAVAWRKNMEKSYTSKKD